MPLIVTPGQLGQRAEFYYQLQQLTSAGIGLVEALKHVSDATFDKDVLQSGNPVLVDFWAEWCGPCKMIGPSLEEISDEMKGKVKIVKLNVDENPGVSGKLGIRSIPTLMLFKDGKLASQKVGAAPKGELIKWITGAI